MATCRSCEQPIVWAKTTGGKAIPLDGEDMGGWIGVATFEDGNVRPTGERQQGRGGSTVMVVEVVVPGEGKHRSHFSSCPKAAEWRRR